MLIYNAVWSNALLSSSQKPAIPLSQEEKYQVAKTLLDNRHFGIPGFFGLVYPGTGFPLTPTDRCYRGPGKFKA